MIGGSTSVFLDGDNFVSGYLVINLGTEAIIGSEVAAAVVATVAVTAEVGEEGVVTVKMTASGRQRRTAQRRESGLRGNMASRKGL